MMTFTVLVEHDTDQGSYGATSPDLPDVFAVGQTRDEVLERFANAARAHLIYLSETHRPLPMPHYEAVTLAIA